MTQQSYVSFFTCLPTEYLKYTQELRHNKMRMTEDFLFRSSLCLVNNNTWDRLIINLSSSTRRLKVGKLIMKSSKNQTNLRSMYQPCEIPSDRLKTKHMQMKRSNLLSEPCEVLYNKGRAGMADYHLLAAIGNISVDKAREILATVDYKLSELARWDLEKRVKFKGIGISKATAMVTAFELGKRRMFEQPEKRFRITSSVDVHGYMKSSMRKAYMRESYT